MNYKINKIWQILIAFVLLAAVTGISSCEKSSYNPASVDPNTTWHFQADIQPVFTAKCIDCHNGTLSPDLRDGKSFAALTKGGFLAAPAETNRLCLQMNRSSHIPYSTDAGKLKVLYWITQGALNN